MNKINLTKDQQEATNTFVSFMANEDQPVMVLSGFPGTGKSTLVGHLIEELPKIQKSIKLINPKAPDYTLQLTATTNKAAENFAEITGMEVKTIQSFLGLTVQTDYRNDTTQLVMRQFREKHNYLLFIDEYSYVDPKLLTWIFKVCKNCKIVFIGDPDQLTPVMASNVPVEAAGFPTIKLTQLVRQQEGSPIAELVSKLRVTVNTGEFFSFTPDNHHIKHMPREVFNQAIQEEFTRSDWNSKESRFLAWTNRRVIEYNNAINSQCNGVTHFQKGDYAVVNKYFMANKTSIKTDATVRILEISDTATLHGVQGKYYTVSGNIVAFCPDRLSDKLERIKQAKANDEINVLQDIDTLWIDLRAMYACTINKSQGSTYNKVFIDLDDLKKCNSGNQIARMLLVGASRARQHVYFTGDLV